MSNYFWWSIKRLPQLTAVCELYIYISLSHLHWLIKKLTKLKLQMWGIWCRRDTCETIAREGAEQWCVLIGSQGEGWKLHGYLGQPWTNGWSNTSDNEGQRWNEMGEVKIQNPVNQGKSPQQVQFDSFGENKCPDRMQRGARHEWVFIMLG